MASQVLSGTGNVSYTNNTGQNVRVVINYLQAPGGGGAFDTISWGNGASVAIPVGVRIGRNLSFNNISSGAGVGVVPSAITSNNGSFDSSIVSFGVPTELMLAAGQTFSVTTSNPSFPSGSYNIVVIPEAG